MIALVILVAPAPIVIDDGPAEPPEETRPAALAVLEQRRQAAAIRAQVQSRLRRARIIHDAINRRVPPWQRQRPSS